MRKINQALLVTVSAAIIIAGCGQDKKQQTASTTSPSPSAAATQSVGPTAQATSTPQADKQAQIQTYYSDSDLTKLVQKSVSIRYTTEQSKYLAALNALKDSQDTQAVPLFKGFTFKSPQIKDGTLTVDLSFSNESRLGSGGEDLLLQALTKTLFQFNEVQAIDILVDGKKAETLMGHKELEHPIKRSQ